MTLRRFARQFTRPSSTILIQSHVMSLAFRWGVRCRHGSQQCVWLRWLSLSLLTLLERGEEKVARMVLKHLKPCHNKTKFWSMVKDVKRNIQFWKGAKTMEIQQTLWISTAWKMKSVKRNRGKWLQDFLQYRFLWWKSFSWLSLSHC